MQPGYRYIINDRNVCDVYDGKWGKINNGNNRTTKSG